jgi:hypothetical protein
MNNSNERRIQSTLEYIKNQLGIDLVLCDYFTGLRKFNDQYYFNIEVEKKDEDRTIPALKRLSREYGVIKDIQSNGVTRWAVHI